MIYRIKITVIKSDGGAVGVLSVLKKATFSAKITTNILHKQYTVTSRFPIDVEAIKNSLEYNGYTVEIV